MVILDSILCPDVDLEVCRLIWCHLVKDGKWNVWKVNRFDRELNLMISGSYLSSKIWDRPVVSFGTCI